MRFISRHDFESGDFKPTVTNERWMAQNILDEYGKVWNYADFPEGESVFLSGGPKDHLIETKINMIGKAYH